MELLKKFDAQNYKDTTSVFEKYTIRGIIDVSYTHLDVYKRQGKCSVNLDMARKICRESLSYYAKIEKSDILERNYKVRKI